MRVINEIAAVQFEVPIKNVISLLAKEERYVRTDFFPIFSAA